MGAGGEAERRTERQGTESWRIDNVTDITDQVRSSVSEDNTRLVLAAIAYLGVGTLLGVLGIHAGYTVALFVLPAVLLGPPVALGGGIGVLLLALSRGAVGIDTVVSMMEYLGVVLVTTLVYGRLWHPRPEQTRWRSALTCVAEYLGALCVGTATTVATLAWLIPLVKPVPYYVGYTGVLLNVAISGGLGLLVLPALVSWGARAANTAQDPPRLRSVVGYVVVALGWFGLTMGISVLAHDLSNFSNSDMLLTSIRETFGTGILGTIVSSTFLNIYTHGQSLVAASGLLGVALAVWLATIVRGSGFEEGADAGIGTASQRYPLTRPEGHEDDD